MPLESPSILVTLFAFLVLLGTLVVVHELGHYWVGRWFGVKAEAFSVGFGKELVGFTDRHGTRWKLSALPLGGYVQFKGDMNPASVPDPDAPVEPGVPLCYITTVNVTRSSWEHRVGWSAQSPSVCTTMTSHGAWWSTASATLPSRRRAPRSPTEPTTTRSAP